MKWWCVEVDLFWWCVLGATVASLLFLHSCRTKHVDVGYLLFVAAVSGIAVAGGLHLIYCAACPPYLVELFDEQGTRLNAESVRVSMDTMHRLDLVVGGGFLVFMSAKEFAKLYRNPSH
jgi:hypothetical protein